MAKCGSIDWSMREKTMSSHPVIDAWKRAFKEKELEKEYEEFQKRLAREKEEQARAAKRLQFHQHLQQMVSDELQRQAWKRRSTHAKLAGPTFAFRAPAESFVQHSPWTKRLVSHMDAYFPPLQSIDSQYAAIPTLADSASSLSVLRPEAAVRAAEKVVEMASDSSEDGSSDEDGPSPEAKPPPPEASRSAAPQPAQAAEASQAVRRSAEGKEEGLVARGIQAANARPSTSPVYSAAASSGAATAPRGSERPATAVAGLAHHPCDSWPGRANDRQRAALAHPPAPRFRRGGAARPQTDSGARQRANVDGAAPAAVVTSPAAEGRLASPPLLRSRSPARLGPLRSACGPSLGGGGSRSAPALGSSGGVGGCGGGCSGGGAARVGTGTARRFKPVREEAREEEGRVPPCLALGAAGSGDEKEEAWRGGAHPPPSLRTRPMASLFANEAAALDADARTRRALRAASCFAELGYEELHKIAAAGAGRSAWLNVPPVLSWDTDHAPAVVVPRDQAAPTQPPDAPPWPLGSLPRPHEPASARAQFYMNLHFPPPGRWLPRYAVLFREGAAANAFYVLVRGRVAQSWLEIDTAAPRAQFELGVEEKAGGETAGVCLGLEACRAVAPTPD